MMDGGMKLRCVYAALALAFATVSRAEDRASGLAGLLEPAPAQDAGRRAASDDEIRLSVRDGSGFPVPFVLYRFSSASGHEVLRGRTSAEGSLVIPRSALPLRAELSARGAAAVAAADAGIAEGGFLRLDGARPLPRPAQADIVFVIDATGSMKPFAEPLKRALRSLKRELDADPAVSARYGFIFVGELDGKPDLATSALSADGAAFESALLRYKPSGGGDEAEPIGSGIARAAEEAMAWRESAARAIFAFSDADLKEGASQAARTAELAGARVHGIGLGDATGERLLREASSLTGGSYVAARLGGAPAPTQGSALTGALEDLLLGIVRGDLGAARATGEPLAMADNPALALLDEAQRRMSAGLAYPEAARRRGVSGSVMLRLPVDQDGKLVRARVERGSGSAVLDRAALALARNAFPVPNPARIRAELFLTVNYRLAP